MVDSDTNSDLSRTHEDERILNLLQLYDMTLLCVQEKRQTEALLVVIIVSMWFKVHVLASSIQRDVIMKHYGLFWPFLPKAKVIQYSIVRIALTYKRSRQKNFSLTSPPAPRSRATEKWTKATTNSKHNHRPLSYLPSSVRSPNTYKKDDALEGAQKKLSFSKPEVDCDNFITAGSGWISTDPEVPKRGHSNV